MTSGVPTLFVGGLPANITRPAVEAIVGRFGTVTSVFLKRGYAFVKFAESHAAQAACVLDGTPYGTKTLAVRVQGPENIKPKAAGSALAAPITTDTPSLFIGSLPDDVTEDNIVALVSPYGTVATIALKHRYAFVTFAEGHAAQQACALNGTPMGNKTLAVRVQGPENQKPRLGAAAAAPALISPAVLPPRATSSVPTLFIGALPQTATAQDVGDLLALYGTVVKVALKKGYAFATFAEPHAAAAACALNGFSYGGKTLAVRVQGPENIKPRTTAPGAPAPLAGPLVAGKSHPSLFVGGVPAQATERELNLLFSPYGNIVKLTPHKKGFCFVDYDRAGCAEKASAILNGFMMDGRRLTVHTQTPDQVGKMKTRPKRPTQFRPY